MESPLPEVNICCAMWETMIDSILVRSYDENETGLAETLTRMLKGYFGNYCPNCGKKILGKIEKEMSITLSKQYKRHI